MRWRLIYKRTPEEPPFPDLFPVKSGPELLAAHTTLLQRLKRSVGVPTLYWNQYYQCCFETFVQYAQLLPASEAHHHAHPGGLLEHSLEVVENALKLRQGKLLPVGAEAEELAGAHDIWTYATVTAALFHDVGKPAVDLTMTLFTRDGRELGQWSPWTNPGFQGVGWYRVNFVRDRQFGLHEQVSLLLVSTTLTRHGLAWLGSDRSVLTAWSASLYGESNRASVLGEMVHQADGLSVAQNLSGSGGKTQIPTARQVPLWERLVTGLRYLLDQKRLPLNTDGAAGWLLDGELWLVVKRTLDELKLHLADEVQTGIPGRNERLMDELQQNGVLIPNPQGKAIWKAKVCGEGWLNAHTLTMLRFPVAHIWSDPDARPSLFNGTITPDSNSTVNEEITPESNPVSTEKEVSSRLSDEREKTRVMDPDSESVFNTDSNLEHKFSPSGDMTIQ